MRKTTDTTSWTIREITPEEVAARKTAVEGHYFTLATGSVRIISVTLPDGRTCAVEYDANGRAHVTDRAPGPKASAGPCRSPNS